MATYHLRVKNDTQPSGIKVSAKRHADYILREDGKSHADYINREGAQSEKTDCVFKDSQLPKWAKGSAQKFFSAANRYESKGNRRYKEIELSLPNELTLEQNREIVSRFIAEHLSSHYYAYAVHEKVGELSGKSHPHVHIMFSERLIDDVERISERPAYKYFRRAARPLKGEQIASFERRREHGVNKSKKATQNELPECDISQLSLFLSRLVHQKFCRRLEVDPGNLQSRDIQQLFFCLYATSISTE